VSCEECLLEEKVLCVIFGVCDLMGLFIIPVSRSVARRQLVERENPSACATVSWKVCISAISLYCLCVSVIKGRAIAEAVSRWHPTAAARVQSRAWSSAICGGQSGVGAGTIGQ
jgi:hypothetical protein